MKFKRLGLGALTFACRRAYRAALQIVALPCGRATSYGIQLVAFDHSKEGVNEIFFAKVTLALALIEQYDRRRLRRMQRDLSAIWLIRAGGAYFDVLSQRCVMSWPDVLSGDVRSIALTLVHEAAHARIFGRGVFRTPEANAARQEAAAVRQQIAFISLLPDNKSLLEHYGTVLQTPWWTPEQKLERELARLRAYDTSAWLARRTKRRYERLITREQTRHEVVRTEKIGGD